MKIYLDFDNTIVKTKYPKIGPVNHMAEYVVRELMHCGHKIILNTHRSHDQELFMESINYCKKLFGLEKMYASSVKRIPPAFDIDTAVKSYELYIDDDSKDMPLLDDGSVDFVMLDKIFKMTNIYKKII